MGVERVETFPKTRETHGWLGVCLIIVALTVSFMSVDQLRLAGDPLLSA
ncbi:MAG: hypothetical protein ACI805_002827, partial [Candidatus Azotimanducaceae bacterium]